MSSHAVRLLIAEDNRADVWLIEEALKRLSIDYEIQNCATAEEAIDAVARFEDADLPIPDLILVDYNLPTGHGGEILAAAAAVPRLDNVPKAVLTSFLRPREHEAALQLGAKCIITKPAGLEEFMSVVGGKI
ncbi:MAG TPA: response regulator, partial [Terriglobales bacterium]|nr:response regulator [Terriglobales bacterium]